VPGGTRDIGRNASVTGLEAVVEVSAPGVVTFATGATSLENVHTVPDPYYVTSSLEVTASQKVIKFVNLPPQANIRIYSVSGILVDVIDHDDIAGGGEEAWDVRNRNNQFVASGVYFYHVEAADGTEKVGRFTVVNSSGISTGSSNR
jgi:flagellar hook assembly protein FlgD